jgi:hypothetical protein
MAILRLFLLSNLLCLPASVSIAQGETIDIVLGTKIAQAESIADGDELWAVLRDGSTYRLIRRVAQIQEYKYKSPIVDDGYHTGRRLIGPRAEAALIHLPGSLDLRAGPITLDEMNHKLVSYSFGKKTGPPTPAMLDVGARSFRLRAVVYPIEGGRWNSMLVYLDEGEESQMIFSYRKASDPGAKVDWVADIDRDGIPDFLLSLSHHYSSVSKRLFLSSFARGDVFTKQVGGIDISLD